MAMHYADHRYIPLTISIARPNIAMAPGSNSAPLDLTAFGPKDPA